MFKVARKLPLHLSRMIFPEKVTTGFLVSENKKKPVEITGFTKLKTIYI